MSFIAAAILGGSAITAGAGLIGDSMNGGQPNIINQYTPGPDAQIGQANANEWAQQLTQDQNDPTGNFGAISPDWNDIWEQTQKQVQQYYNGSAMNPGVNDQIKASFAQRGMSGDPAASFLETQSGAQQASTLADLSAQQNIAQQQFAQTGKENWMNSMAQFQQATAPEQGNWGGQVIVPTEGQQIANTVGSAASGAAQLGIQQQSNNNQLQYLQSIFGGGGQGQIAPTTFAPGGSFSDTAPFSLGPFQT